MSKTSSYQLNQTQRERLSQIHMMKNAGVYTYQLPVNSACEHTIEVAGKKYINFISNNYLGFSNHPEVKAAVEEAIWHYGIGMSGSPIACGTTELHNQLRKTIAEFYGKEDAALFASGYQALAGSIQAAIGKGDLALIDNLSHRSIIDGLKLSGADCRTWNHNDPQDLNDLLKGKSTQFNRKLVIVDSVYSMDGDLAPLPQLNEICSQYSDCFILVDEAHSLGILGPNGKGILDHFPKAHADFVAGTFSKFAGSVGGFVAGNADYIEYLQHFSSPFVFSAASPPALVAGVLKAFELLKTDPRPHQQLWTNVHYMLESLKSLGFNTKTSQSPVIPILIGDSHKTMQTNAYLLQNGILASPVVYPGVSPKEARIRLGVMATHSKQELDQALEVLAKGKKIFEF